MLKSRLTVFEKVYHQRPGEQPRSFEASYDRELESGELPYVRELTIGGDWQRIDCGWVTQGLVCIKNEEATFHRVVPSGAEVDDAQARVIIVACGDLAGGSDGGFLLRPQETFRAEPTDLKNVQLRCRHASARCTLTVIPS